MNKILLHVFLLDIARIYLDCWTIKNRNMTKYELVNSLVWHFNKCDLCGLQEHIYFSSMMAKNRLDRQ